MKRSLLQLAATGCLVSSASLADTVSLASGDRLSGTLARMEADSLVFETPDAGKLKLPWLQVSRIGTDVAVRVRLADGIELDGQLRIRIGSLAETMPLALDRIAAINPPRHPDKTVMSARTPGRPNGRTRRACKPFF